MKLQILKFVISILFMTGLAAPSLATGDAQPGWIFTLRGENSGDAETEREFLIPEECDSFLENWDRIRPNNQNDHNRKLAVHGVCEMQALKEIGSTEYQHDYVSDIDFAKLSVFDIPDLDCALGVYTLGGLQHCRAHETRMPIASHGHAIMPLKGDNPHLIRNASDPRRSWLLKLKIDISDPSCLLEADLERQMFEFKRNIIVENKAAKCVEDTPFGVYSGFSIHLYDAIYRDINEDGYRDVVVRISEWGGGSNDLVSYVVLTKFKPSGRLYRVWDKPPGN